MRIEIVKRADGAGVLRCTRADGSVAWQKQGRHAAHFALHDLTHYTVETTLGFDKGFFGLIRSGWEMDDTTGKGQKGALPPEAIQVEWIVGALDSERRVGVQWTLDEFREYSQTMVSQEQIDRLRALREELFIKWRAVAPGDKLELTFS